MFNEILSDADSKIFQNKLFDAKSIINKAKEFHTSNNTYIKNLTELNNTEQKLYNAFIVEGNKYCKLLH